MDPSKRFRALGYRVFMVLGFKVQIGSPKMDSDIIQSRRHSEEGWNSDFQKPTFSC